jgi:tetrahydromethanopterin S-methyltransferase subunit E
MKRLESIRTAVVESPIPIPLIADVVTASVGHIPSVKTRVGFSLIIPL